MSSVFSQDDIFNFTGSRNVRHQKAWCKYRGIRYDYQHNGKNIYFTMEDYKQCHNPIEDTGIRMDLIS